ncbi:MAG TPA: hypothetical protein VJ966_00500 [Actinomycetes bacterium]|nr:hypothetical protein [Actinomycetes bacterium]
MMRRHELDPVSLTFGFAFTGLGLLFLVGRADQAFRLRWIWPILLLVLGVGILADLARHRSRDEEPPLQREGDEDLERRGDRTLDPEGDEELDSEEVDPEGVVDNRQHPR